VKIRYASSIHADGITGSPRKPLNEKRHFKNCRFFPAFCAVAHRAEGRFTGRRIPTFPLELCSSFSRTIRIARPLPNPSAQIGAARFSSERLAGAAD